MRRSVSALLVSVVTAMALPLPSAGAADARHPRHVPVVAPRPFAWPNQLVHTLAQEASSLRLTLPHLVAKWQRVAVCEVDGNWSMVGPSYSGIGFSNATWRQYGGSRFAPYAGEASRFQQILIGMRVTQGWIPDQDGCAPGGW